MKRWIAPVRGKVAYRQTPKKMSTQPVYLVSLTISHYKISVGNARLEKDVQHLILTSFRLVNMPRPSASAIDQHPHHNPDIDKKEHGSLTCGAHSTSQRSPKMQKKNADDQTEGRTRDLLRYETLGSVM